MRLIDVIAPEAVCLGVEVASAAEVIGLLSRRLQDLGKVRPSFPGAVRDREKTMPTGLPLGRVNVAVPHTDREHVIAPALALATLKTPVAFGCIDDPDESIPVSVVGVTAWTDKDAQIAMLHSIASFWCRASGVVPHGPSRASRTLGGGRGPRIVSQSPTRPSWVRTDRTSDLRPWRAPSARRGRRSGPGSRGAPRCGSTGCTSPCGRTGRASRS